MRYTLIIALGSFALCACEQRLPPAEEQAAATASAISTEEPMHAPPHAVPGSYEDWCGGHLVPESMCTRCNPSLIPAFKATGDWCESHGLPESQCLVCNPDLKIERPPKTAQANP